MPRVPLQIKSTRRRFFIFSTIREILRVESLQIDIRYLNLNAREK